MPVVVGIRFKDSGKIYYFDPQEFGSLVQGDAVIVETVRGPELAKVASDIKEVEESEIIGELKPVIRRAEQADFDRLTQLNARHEDLLSRCGEKILEHALPMRLIKAEYSFDGSRLTFYFTAEKRVDFRMLVRDLARTFKTRIELRQIGPRDEAKLLGGIGPCGRVLCCATFLPDYARVSIKMAKDQDLPLNPSKISGVCGRLLCCLSYEHEQYTQIKAELPRKGSWVQTPDGPGEVIAVNVVRETVTVLLAESAVQEEYKPELLKEATAQVAHVARSRNAEGITPAARMASPPREQRPPSERRLLRDEIENPEVLEALAMLEEGEWEESREQGGRHQGEHRSRGEGRGEGRGERRGERPRQGSNAEHLSILDSGHPHDAPRRQRMQQGGQGGQRGQQPRMPVPPPPPIPELPPPPEIEPKDLGAPQPPKGQGGPQRPHQRRRKKK